MRGFRTDPHPRCGGLGRERPRVRISQPWPTRLRHGSDVTLHPPWPARLTARTPSSPPPRPRRSVPPTGARPPDDAGAMIANSAGTLATAGIEAFNRADWDALRELCSPSVVYSETGTGLRLEGIDACDAAWHAWRVAMPDLTG